MDARCLLTLEETGEGRGGKERENITRSFCLPCDLELWLNTHTKFVLIQIGRSRRRVHTGLPTNRYIEEYTLFRHCDFYGGGGPFGGWGLATVKIAVLLVRMVHAGLVLSYSR